MGSAFGVGMFLCDTHYDGTFNQIGSRFGAKVAHKSITMVFNGSLSSGNL
jgi:hypothetical protein